MATYRKRGKRWQAIIRLAGHDPESATHATRAEAKAWAERREDELREGVRPERTVADAMLAYRETVLPRLRGAPKELVRINALLRDDALASAPLTDDGAIYAQWRDRRLAQVSTASVLREWTLIRSVLEHARRDLGWIAVNPMRDVRKPKQPMHRERRISDDEIERMRLALGWLSDDVPVTTYSQQIAVMFLLAIETAMRAGELLSLTWPHVDLRYRVAHLPMTKNGQSRDVPLSRRAIDLLRAMQGADPVRVFTVSADSRDALWRKARANAKIPDLRFHDTRHEAITRLARKLDVLDLARMVGHRDLGSLRAYYNATASEIAARLD